MNIKNIFTAAVCLFASFGAVAQNTVSGTVSDENGEALLGANVYWLGTSKGVITDGNGNFVIEKISGKKLLAISYLGFITDTVDISKKSENQPVKVVLKDNSRDVGEVVVAERRHGTSEVGGALNGLKINQAELFKAACCNLGESFMTNPSVDVSYSDAATGAKQIKLLGLSGLYVQMLAENIPDFRLTASPYALGYVPGAWLKGIQVSKGASSVKNGYESITGQIDVEYLKPDDDEGIGLNVYGNSEGRAEINADVNKHITEHLSTEILAHYENSFVDMDENGDNFYDKPDVSQVNFHNRWHYHKGKYIFHGGLSVLDEKRESGQLNAVENIDLYRISMNTRRYNAYMKNAFVIDPSCGTNIALITSATMHNLDSEFGAKSYDNDEKNLYAQLVFETDFSPMHNLSAGFSVNADKMNQDYNFENIVEKETVSGVYAQYTFNYHDKIIFMAGLRADNSNIYNTFVTPRFHLKIKPSDIFSLGISAGKGYRSPHALAENHFLLSSGRNIIIENLTQESAWNMGSTMSWKIPLGGKRLKINTEYYYTTFLSQALADFDSSPRQIVIKSSEEKSYSHTFQVDAAYDIFKGFEVSAAYRLNDVQAVSGGRLQSKPLTNKYKALITASYKTPLGIWQFDANLQLNGGGRLPDYYDENGVLVSRENFEAYPQLNVQITKWFRKFSIYLGGENLTGYHQKNPIISSKNPWSENFEPTLIYAPVSGAMFYLGFRANLFRE
ncbi:MAG: TonB-dependent receptor [Bacteroidales bacterium]|nr:TonB-dependent receptor [Bacteroidales bacterium]